ALYRLLAFAAANHGVDRTNEELLKALAAHLAVQVIAANDGKLQSRILEGDEASDDIRTESVGAVAAQGAARPAVREAWRQRQREVQEQPGRVAEVAETGVGVAAGTVLSSVFIASPAYGTRASTALIVHADGTRQMIERSFGPHGGHLGEVALYI
ncbi:hypothetical protein B1218_32980, partial [Pseudomonas ogarae]